MNQFIPNKDFSEAFEKQHIQEILDKNPGITPDELQEKLIKMYQDTINDGDIVERFKRNTKQY